MRANERDLPLPPPQPPLSRAGERSGSGGVEKETPISNYMKTKTLALATLATAAGLLASPTSHATLLRADFTAGTFGAGHVVYDDSIVPASLGAYASANPLNTDPNITDFSMTLTGVNIAGDVFTYNYSDFSNTGDRISFWSFLADGTPRGLNITFSPTSTAATGLPSIANADRGVVFLYGPALGDTNGSLFRANFSPAVPVTVPSGGSSIAIFGCALLGIGAYRRTHRR